MICSKCKAEHAVGQNVAVLGAAGFRTEYFCFACWPKPPHAAQPLTPAQAANAEEERQEHLDDLEEANQRIAGFRSENVRLRREMLALIAVGEKLRADMERSAGQALDYGRDIGRILRALDEAKVPCANPEPGRPWRVDDRVRWALDKLQVTGECVDQMEEQLAAANAELADARHQLARTQVAACRIVASGAKA
jgi:chromosome segregation ATPase